MLSLAAALVAALSLHAQNEVIQRLDSAADRGTLLQHLERVATERFGKEGEDSLKRQHRRERMEQGDAALSRFDSLMAANYFKKNIDTAYIIRPPERLTVKLRGNFSGSSMEVRGTLSGEDFDSEVKSQYRGTLSISALYRGIGAGIAINPAKFKGKNQDYEFNLNSYSNRYGFDVIYQMATTWSGWATMGDKRIDVPADLLTQHALNINGYYVFNYRRFSYPAAFSQSYIQRRSAGSWMLAASFEGMNIRSPGDDDIGLPKTIIHTREFAVGGGYGYNLVVRKRWLFHLSALPTVIFYTHDKVKSDDEQRRMKYHLPSVIITGRYAAVYNWPRHFAGLSMVFNASVAGDSDRLEMIRTKWRLRVFYGFRL